MSSFRIAIVGGGTAGWLSANHLGRVLSQNSSVSITLIESPEIPVIGVGEGTVPAIRNSLQQFGIRETDFINSCDVSFKQGIKYVNWLDKRKHGFNNSYYHLFDYPFPFGEDLTSYWLSGNQFKSKSFAHIVSSQASVCDSCLSPKNITTPEYQGDTTYAYHFDARKFAALLKKNAMERYSVEYKSANVIDANLNGEGNIGSLVTKELGELGFDFYIDATGFSCVLLGKKMGVEFVSRKDQLLVDTALAVQIPTQPGEEIPPYTIATAHQAGWIWDIALPERRGVGLVYSTRHLPDSEAGRKLSHYLGVSKGELKFRKIPVVVGRRKKFWVKNCVAMGLAQGFVEPLEATSILLTDFGARLLAEKLPLSVRDFELFSQQYNEIMLYSWDRVFEFVKMHYCISDRSDSKFWIDNRNPNTIPEVLSERLRRWRMGHPKTFDFFSKFEIFDVENFLYVLYGMHYPTDSVHLSELDRKRLESVVSSVERTTEKVKEKLPGHRELLNKIHRYGLQKS